MTSWENTTKQGVNAPLWGDGIMPWDLTAPWQYVNPTPISYTNKSINSTSWTNQSKAVEGSGTPIGLLLALTQAGSTAITWTNKSKN